MKIGVSDPPLVFTLLPGYAHLIPETGDVRHIRDRVRREDTCRALHGANAGTALEEVDRLEIVRIRDRCTCKGARHLSADIHRHFPPGKVAERRERDGYL